MIWPQERSAGEAEPPRGYAIRAFRPGDEGPFLRLMGQTDFDPWDDAKLQDNLARVIPHGWFFAVEERSGGVVGTIMCLHNYTGRSPFTGDVGWLACDRAHRGRGIGHALTAQATRRFLEAGYRRIQLHTEDYRLAAVRIYLKVGYVPVLHGQESWSQWEEVCSQLGWPFDPDGWLAAATAGQGPP